MSEKKKSNVLPVMCIVILVLIIIAAVYFIVFSDNEEESSSSGLSSVSSESSSNDSSSSIDFLPESSYEIDLTVGQSCMAEITDIETESKLIWVTSNSDIAAVDDLGNITAVAEGSCTVTVIIMDTDQSIAVTVNVTN